MLKLPNIKIMKNIYDKMNSESKKHFVALRQKLRWTSLAIGLLPLTTDIVNDNEWEFGKKLEYEKLSFQWMRRIILDKVTITFSKLF